MVVDLPNSGLPETDPQLSESLARDERAAYKLLGMSVILPPALASLALFGPSAAFLLVFGFAYYYLIIMVLPLAFAGLGIGYYLARRKSVRPAMKIRYQMLGYLGGYVAGLEFVFAYPLSSLQHSLGIPLIAAGAFGGLVSSFYLAKIGTEPIKQTNLPIINQYSFNARKNSTSSFRITTMVVLICATAITILWPFIV